MTVAPVLPAGSGSPGSCWSCSRLGLCGQVVLSIPLIVAGVKDSDSRLVVVARPLSWPLFLPLLGVLGVVRVTVYYVTRVFRKPRDTTDMVSLGPTVLPIISMFTTNRLCSLLDPLASK